MVAPHNEDAEERLTGKILECDTTVRKWSPWARWLERVVKDEREMIRGSWRRTTEDKMKWRNESWVCLDCRSEEQQSWGSRRRWSHRARWLERVVKNERKMRRGIKRRTTEDKMKWRNESWVYLGCRSKEQQSGGSRRRWSPWTRWLERVISGTRKNEKSEPEKDDWRQDEVEERVVSLLGPKTRTATNLKEWHHHRHHLETLVGLTSIASSRGRGWREALGPPIFPWTTPRPHIFLAVLPPVGPTDKRPADKKTTGKGPSHIGSTPGHMSRR